MATDVERRKFLIKSASFATAAAVPAAFVCRTAYAQTENTLTDLTAVAAVTAMRNGEIKAEDYARALLDRAQALQALNAFRAGPRDGSGDGTGC